MGNTCSSLAHTRATGRSPGLSAGHRDTEGNGPIGGIAPGGARDGVAKTFPLLFAASGGKLKEIGRACPGLAFPSRVSVSFQAVAVDCPPEEGVRARWRIALSVCLWSNTSGSTRGTAPTSVPSHRSPVTRTGAPELWQATW